MNLAKINRDLHTNDCLRPKVELSVFEPEGAPRAVVAQEMFISLAERCRAVK